MMCQRNASVVLCWALVMAVAAVLVSPPVGARPSYVKCSSSSECDADECCVLNMDRYSIPSCRPMRGEGEICRREPYNVTVGYPNGDTIDLVNVYRIFCGCSSDLHCSPQNHRCVKGPEN